MVMRNINNGRVKITNHLKTIGLFNNIIRRNPIYYNQAFSLFDKLTSFSLDERISWTDRNLSQLLKKASQTDYGRKVAGGEHVSSWPLLEKSTVRDNPESFLTGLSIISALDSTGGTTGLPLKLYRSPFSVVIEQACMDRLMSTRSISLKRNRIAIMRGDSIKDPTDLEPPFWQLKAGGKHLFLSSYHLYSQTLEAYYRALQDFCPDCLMAYPTSLESLSGLLLKEKKRLSIPLVATSSETLTYRVRQMAVEAFGCEILDYYGQGERVAFAYSYEKDKYHFLPGYSYVELKFVSTGETEDLYEIVGTSFWNLAMPLVRYCTGDLIRLPRGLRDKELERVRYGISPFLGVAGRSGDYLISPEGVRLFIGQLPIYIENVLQMQVIQESRTRVRILVIPHKDFSERDKDSIIKNARERIPNSVHIYITIVDQVERTPRGKAPFVIRRSGVDL